MTAADDSQERTVHLDGLAPSPAGGTEVCLVVTTGSRAGAIVTLGTDPVTIGRAADAALCIPDPGISSRHCVVRRLGPIVVVEDLGSTNGVYVDDVRITGAAPLAVGGALRLGRVVLRLELRDAEELERQNWLESELRKAADYVRALLPAPLRDDTLSVDWRFVPSAHLGGDAFEYRRLDDGRWVVCLLDVCGHGPGAALHSVAALQEIRRGTLGGTDYGSPGAVLAAMNDAFPMERHGGNYFSLWYGVYDPATRRLVYGSAGHPAPLLLRRDGERLERLPAAGTAIGLLEDIVYRDVSVDVQPGDRLYLFSDGAFEVRRAGGGTGTREEFEELVAASADRGPGEPERIERALRLLMADDAFDDDFSLVVAEFR